MRFFPSLPCLFTALIVLTGCGQPNMYQAPPPPEVLVSAPIQQSVTSYVEQTGTAQASERVELRPRVAGFLLERNFEDGEMVKADQLLFVIDEEPFKVKLQYAKAKEAEAIANLQKAESSKSLEIAQAQLQLNQSEQQLARVNHERNVQLLEQNALSRQEYDKTEAALRTEIARVQASKAEVEQAEVNFQTNILSAKAALDLAKSEVRTAEIDLGYCRVHSPIDGIIDRRAFDVGNYVSTDNSSVLAAIVKIDPIYGYAAISENELIRIKSRYAGDGPERKIPIQMGIGDDHTYPYEGTIDYIAPMVQAGTGTVQVRGIFKNAGIVMPGMFVRIRVPSEEKPDALLVSERSIGYDQAGSYVYIVNNEDMVERRAVTTGTKIESNTVVEGDLKLGDRVVADGLLKVRPGTKVSPKLVGEPEAPAGEPEPAGEKVSASAH